MPLPLPQLDNRTYADLLEEARSLIPAYNPSWTDHNPSDAGITLIELFAWLTEMTIYRVNRVPDANYHAFLQLLNGSTQPATGSLDAAIQQTVLALRERYRAATCDDFVYLATTTWPKTPEALALGAAGLVARARCVPRQNLEMNDPIARAASAPGHVSLVVVPTAPSGATPQPTPELLAALTDFFDRRRLLTTRHHVVGPQYVLVTIKAKLFRRPDAVPDQVKSQVVDALQSFFHPLTGGDDQQGWPFGRDVYVSEIYAILEQVSGIDYVTDVTVETIEAPAVAAARLQKTQDGRLIGVRLEAYELVDVDPSGQNFSFGSVQ